jgi:hypothetical protein
VTVIYKVDDIVWPPKEAPMPIEDTNAMPLPEPASTPEMIVPAAPPDSIPFIRPFTDKTVGVSFLAVPENQFPGEEALALVERALSFVGAGNPGVAIPLLTDAIAKLKKGAPK